MDACVSPVRFPAVDVGLRLFRALEAQSLELVLRVAHVGLDLAFSIWIADPARQGGHAIVSEHVAIERVEFRVVDVGLEHALFQVVEHHDARSTAESAECSLVKLGPDLRTRFEGEKTHALATAAEGEHEHSHAAVLARCGVADHRAVAGVVHLAFFARGGLDHGMGVRNPRSAQLANEAAHALVAGVEAVVVDQILPDHGRVAAQSYGFLDQVAVRLTRARRWVPAMKTNKSNISRLENVNSSISPTIKTIENYARAAGYNLDINFIPSKPNSVNN